MAILAAAGLDFEVIPAAIDEPSLKKSFRKQAITGPRLAQELAAAKALSVSKSFTDAVVIGADQILLFGGREYDKPETMDAAKQMLQKLRGHVHELICAVCVARQGQIVWRHGETTRLHMRDFSDRFLEDYTERAGTDILTSVGAYQLEGLGAQLFSHIDGDYFTILGLPLLPLLTYLRDEDLLLS